MNSNGLNYILCFAFPTIFLGCGVKGKPLPPLNPPILGNGHIQSQKTIPVKSKNKDLEAEPKGDPGDSL